MANPFYLQVVPDDAPFCDRTLELAELTSFAENGANVVLYSPRRYGKTSLIRRVQKGLADRGAVTIFVDLFGVASVDEVAARLANAVFACIHRSEPLWKKGLRAIGTFRPVLKPDPDGGVTLSVEPAAGRGGLPLLEQTVDSLGRFIDASEALFHVALDEFQEIVTLDNALQIEAALRTRIQQQRASYFFIGSRRRVLLGIFNERQRPFFQSAVNYPLKRLPEDELALFIRQQFVDSGTACTHEAAARLVKTVESHPYYAEKLAFLVHELGEELDENVILRGFERLLESERPVFEAIIMSLPSRQRRLLQAVAREPTGMLLASAYVRRHNLGSVGGVQHGTRRLAELDLIERESDGASWRVVDPMLARWLNRMREERIE